MERNRALAGSPAPATFTYNMRTASLFLGLLLVGCSGAPSAEAPAESSDEANLETRSFAVTMASSGASLTLDDAPRLKAGASGKLTCSGKFEGVAGERWSCKRGSEKLELLHRPSKDEATLLYKSGTTARETFRCTKSGDELRCKTAQRASGGLTSPFPSTVDGVTIPNAHAIDGASLLMRGMAPKAPQFDELEAAGVKAVLIFKNATGNGSDVEDEQAELARRGFDAARVHHIPFRWKEIASFKEACEQTVDALAFLKKQEAARKKTFFHCTVGEDRTGMLAAMARLVRTPGASASELFQMEMCENGYGQGNPQKPFTVTRALDEELTPVYRKLAFLVKSGAITASNLDASACANDPEGTAAFEDDEEFSPSGFRCGTSTAY